jgi:hypothetical protein
MGEIENCPGHERMAGTTGLEPATSDVTGRRSNQLNYVPAMSRRYLDANTAETARQRFRNQIL